MPQKRIPPENASVPPDSELESSPASSVPTPPDFLTEEDIAAYNIDEDFAGLPNTGRKTVQLPSLVKKKKPGYKPVNRKRKGKVPKPTGEKFTKKKLAPALIPLNTQQQIFVDEYLKDLNATQAALRAGYSKRTAKNIGHVLLGRPHIANAIQKAINEQQKRTQISADQVVFELGKIAFSNVRDLFDENGNLIPIRDLPPHVSAAIAQVDLEIKEDRKTKEVTMKVAKVKMWSKPQALELLGRRFNLFSPDINVDTGGGPVKFEFHLGPSDSEKVVSLEPKIPPAIEAANE